VASSRTRLSALAAVVVLFGATRADAATPSAAGAARLRALLVTSGVPLVRGQTPPARSFPAAWRTFRRFTLIPAPGGNPSGNTADDLLFEFGVFESNFYGTSFEVELTRQYETASGELQQVHLLVHFPVNAFISITRSLRATPCLAGDGCSFRCFFAGDVLVPHPCRVVPRETAGYRVGDMTLRASQTGGGDLAAQRRRWVEGVEASPVFRALLARHVRPDGFEVWQEPADR
jgi:hypothetical protein